MPASPELRQEARNRTLNHINGKFKCLSLVNPEEKTITKDTKLNIVCTLCNTEKIIARRYFLDGNIRCIKCGDKIKRSIADPKIKFRDNNINTIVNNFKCIEVIKYVEDKLEHSKLQIQCLKCGVHRICGYAHFSSNIVKCQICKNTENVKYCNSFIGSKYNQLTILDVVAPAEGKHYKAVCKCDCGKTKIIRLARVIQNETKTCGCIFQSEEFKNKIKSNLLLGFGSSKREVDKTYLNAMSVYNKSYNDETDLTFFKFLALSQENCHYCGCEPYKSKNKYEENEHEFIYNGVDRKDSDLEHTIDNCVTSCKTCNFIKDIRPYDEFISFIKDFKFNKFEPLKIGRIEVNQDDLTVYKNIYSDSYSEMDFEDFHYLIHQECFYCGKDHVNSNKGVRYNGIDRIDSSRTHTIDNVVPCCKFCNYSKKKQTLEEYYSNINKIKTFMKL